MALKRLLALKAGAGAPIEADYTMSRKQYSYLCNLLSNNNYCGTMRLSLNVPGDGAGQAMTATIISTMVGP